MVTLPPPADCPKQPAPGGAPRLPGPWADRPAWTALPGRGPGCCCFTAPEFEVLGHPHSSPAQPSAPPCHTASPSPAHSVGLFPSFVGHQTSPGELEGPDPGVRGGQSLRTDPLTHTRSTRTAPQSTQPPTKSTHSRQSTQPPTKADSHWISEGVLSAGPCCPRE